MYYPTSKPLLVPLTPCPNPTNYLVSKLLGFWLHYGHFPDHRLLCNSPRPSLSDGSSRHCHLVTSSQSTLSCSLSSRVAVPMSLPFPPRSQQCQIELQTHFMPPIALLVITMTLGHRLFALDCYKSSCTMLVDRRQNGCIQLFPKCQDSTQTPNVSTQCSNLDTLVLIRKKTPAASTSP